MTTPSKKNKLHNLIIFIFIAVNFSYILSYAYNNMAFLILLYATSITLVLLHQQSFKYITTLPLIRWIVFFLTINLIWIILPHSMASEKSVGDLFITLMYLFSLTLLLYFDDNRLTTARTAILFITIISIFNHIIELFIPELFYSLDSITKIIGRSSGFYGNSTGAGEAIILGMILSYGLVPQKFKAFFLLFALLGVIPTFSRAAIAFWFIVVFVLVMTKAIRKKEALMLGSIILLLTAIALPILITFLDTSLGEEAENILTRLDFFSSKQTISDGSAQYRLTVAKAAFQHFSDSPFFGAGFSFTSHWEYEISTHNLYLEQMAEFGLIGIFIYPFLITSIIWQASGEAKKTGIAFATFLVLIGFTSHNILDGFHTLLAIAVMASWAYKSKVSETTYQKRT